MSRHVIVYFLVGCSYRFRDRGLQDRRARLPRDRGLQDRRARLPSGRGFQDRRARQRHIGRPNERRNPTFKIEPLNNTEDKIFEKILEHTFGPKYGPIITAIRLKYEGL